MQAGKLGEGEIVSGKSGRRHESGRSVRMSSVLSVYTVCVCVCVKS